jgi:hypothetical protein
MKMRSFQASHICGVSGFLLDTHQNILGAFDTIFKKLIFLVALLCAFRGVSSVDGSFSVPLPEEIKDPVYVFSYVGSEKKEVAYTGKYMEVVLSADRVLSEVVVTGVFNKPKEGYTGSAAMITSKDLEVAGNRSILSSIRNIDPSFNIADNITIGSDPNKLPTITMRGASSLPVNLNELQADAQNAESRQTASYLQRQYEHRSARFEFVQPDGRQRKIGVRKSGGPV